MNEQQFKYTNVKEVNGGEVIAITISKVEWGECVNKVIAIAIPSGEWR